MCQHAHQANINSQDNASTVHLLVQSVLVQPTINVYNATMATYWTVPPANQVVLQENS